MCAACKRVLRLLTDAGELACECGVVVQGVNISDDAEYRCFAGEEGQEEKKRADNYTREDESSAPMPPGLASSDKMRRWADGRVNQVVLMLAHLDTEEPGRAVLSKDEVRAALGDVRAAAFYQASLSEDGAEQQTASALFWAIAVAQNVATRRPGGWLVDSELSAAAWGMDALSEYISCFQSESHVTAERLGNATQVRGGGIGRAAALVHDVKRRKLRIDSLGSADARRTKLLALDVLLLAAGRPGLDARVKDQQLPQVRAPLPLGRTRACLAARVGRWEEQLARRRGAGPAFGRLGSGLRAQVSRARGKTQVGSRQGGPFLCPTPFVPNASVPNVARTNFTRTTPFRTWRRQQSRLARLPRPARAARRGLARCLLQPTQMTMRFASPRR